MRRATALAFALGVAACGRFEFDARSDAGAGSDASTVPARADLVQQGISITASNNLVTAQYLAGQLAGDLDVVVIGWTSATVAITSVRDSAGNTYQAAGPPEAVLGVSQAIWYAENIAAAAPGANTVTVTFSGPPPTPDVRIVEYSGIATAGALDVAQSSGANTAMPGVAITTTAPDLIVGATTSTSGCDGVGNGDRVRVLDDLANTVTDLDAPVPGTYHAGCVASATQPWVAQAAAFRVDPAARRAPITVQQTSEDETGTGMTELFGNQLAGDTLFVMVAWSAPSSTATLHDGAGNTYAAIAGFPITFDAAAVAVAAFYASDIAAQPAATNTLVATFSPPLGTGTYAGVYAIELHGVAAAAPFDDDAVRSCSNTTSCASGMLATHFGPEIVLTPEQTNASMLVDLPGSGYKLVYFSSPTSGTANGTVLQFQTEASPGQFETTFQSSGSQQWLQSLFAFH